MKFLSVLSVAGLLGTAVVEKKAELRNARTPGWTSAERPVKAARVDEQEKRL